MLFFLNMMTKKEVKIAESDRRGRKNRGNTSISERLDSKLGLAFFEGLMYNISIIFLGGVLQ